MPPRDRAVKPERNRVRALTGAFSLALTFNCFATFTALTLAPSSAQDSSEPFRLSGGISHSDRLDPLPEDDRIGSVVGPGAPSADIGPAPQAVPQGAQPYQQIVSQPRMKPATVKNRPPAKQVVAPTFGSPNAARQPNNAQWQAAASLQQNQAYRQAQAYQQAQKYQHAQASQQARAYQQAHAYQQIPQAQGQRISREQQLEQASIARQQAMEGLKASQAAQSQQAAVNMLAHLNAHVNTQGSPLPPRFQEMPAAQMDPRTSPRGPALNAAAQYQKNLQGIASLDLSQTARNKAMQAGVQAGGQSVKVEVPFWLAGEWVRSEASESSRIELPSGKHLKAVGKQKASVTDVFGMTRDKDGKVWMTVPLHNKGSVDRGFAIDRSSVHKYQLILTGKTSALIRVQASHTVVDKATNRVIQAYQDEELNSYSLIRDGLVQTDSSVKVFDQMGNPKLLTHAVSTERRVRKL